jgi:hypothetical protein
VFVRMFRPAILPRILARRHASSALASELRTGSGPAALKREALSVADRQRGPEPIGGLLKRLSRGERPVAVEPINDVAIDILNLDY